MKNVVLWLCTILISEAAIAQTYETGSITIEQPGETTWLTASFQRTYSAPPVVITGPLSEFGSDPAHVRIRDVTTTGFEYQIEEFEYSTNSFHEYETFSYLVIEPGRHLVNGHVWEAAVLTSDPVAGKAENLNQLIPFSAAFGTPPSVFTQVASNQDPVAVIPRVIEVTSSDFRLKMQEEEARDGIRSNAEVIHYLAIESGEGTIGEASSTHAYQVTTVATNQVPLLTSFSRAFSSPVLLAASQTTTGFDPFVLRYRTLSEQGVKLRLQEENSDGAEDYSHNIESVGYLVMEGTPSPNERLIWYEPFSHPTATTSDNGSSAWSLDASALGNDGDNYFEVRSGRLEAKNTDSEVVWQSEEISIDGYSDVKVAIDIEGAGTSSFENNDYLQVYYRLDGGPETPLVNGLWINSFGLSTAMVGGLTGSELQLIVKVRNSSDGEHYYIDNVRVFTESDNRYTIQDGNWNDPAIWSYTPGGPPCDCLPDQLSNTYIDGHTVTLATSGYTHNLTVRDEGELNCTADDIALWLYGDATLDVESGGAMNVTGRSNITFTQWNSRHLDDDQTRVGLTLAGVNSTINVDDPTGVELYEISLDAKGTYLIQGTGAAHLADDLDINNEAEVINNLTGDLIVESLQFGYPGITFTNNSTIVITDELHYQQSDGHCVNNGMVETNTLLTSPNGTVIDNSLFTNNGSGVLKVEDITDLDGHELTINNYGAIEMIGDVVSVDPNEGLFHNYTGALWKFSGNDFDSDLQLFAGYENNEVHYDGTSYQELIAPRDIINPSEVGSYWHLTTSNKNTNGISISYKHITFPRLNVNGNFTIIGSSTGRANLAANPNVDLSVAGHWERQGPTVPDYAIFGEGYLDETVIFNGIADQSILRTETFNNLIVDKNNGKLNTAESIHVEQRAHFQNGVVEADDAPFVFNSVGTVGMVSDNSHVRGKVTKEFLFGTIASSASYTITIYAAGRENDETMVLSLDGEVKQTWTNVGGDFNIPTFQQYSYTTNQTFSSLEVRFANDRGPNDLRVGHIDINGSVFEAEDAETIDNLRDGSCNPQGQEALSCNGSFRWVFPQAEEYTQFTFPVGDGSQYRPLRVSQVHKSAHFTAEYLSTQVPQAEAKPDSMLNLASCGYWSLSRLSPEVASTYVTLFWDDSCISDLDELIIARWDGTQWTALSGTISGNVSAGSITTVVPITDLGSSDNPSLFTLAELSDLPQARDDQATTLEDTDLTVNLLANDTDDDGIDKTSIVIVNGPLHGTATLDPITGQLTYLPENNFFGTDQLVYTVQDNKGLASNPATLSITIESVNDAPVALNDQATTPYGTLLNSPSVVTNDSDSVEGHLLTPTLLTQPAQGTLTFYPDGSYAFAPGDFYGTTTFTYKVCDSGTPSACDTATVTISVRSPEVVNLAPVAQSDSFTTPEDLSLTANVLTNDTDPNGDFLTVTLRPVRDPQHGSVDFSSNGTLVYVPHPDFHGTDQLTYQVCDNAQLCDTATVIITVTPTNDAPVATNDTTTATEAQPITGNLLTNDYDIDQDTLQATLVVSPSSGQVVLQPNGSFTYTPDDTYTGQEEFTYQVCDSGQPVLCDEAIVTITVSPNNTLRIPKGFSPNGDAVNDAWIISGIRAYPSNQVTIFNRWGNIVYRAQGYDNLNVRWQGQTTQGTTLGGRQLPDGTYFYVIDLNASDPRQSASTSQNGYVILKR